MGAYIELTPLRLRLFSAALLGAAAWLCPIWWIPTPSVMPMLWAGLCLALWFIFDAFCNAQPIESRKLDPIFYCLLISLASMIVWRSDHAPNTLAAVLCLLCVGLTAKLSVRLSLIGAAHGVAWGWLLAGVANSAIGLTQYVGWTAEPLGTALGLLRQRNQLATLCNISLLSLLYLWLRYSCHIDAAKHPRPLHVNILAGLACLLLTAGLAATCSRAGLLEFMTLHLIALAYALFKSRKPLIFALLFGITSYLLFAFLLPAISGVAETIFGRVIGLAPTADTVGLISLNDGRRLLWADTISLIQTQPLIGVGWRELAWALQTADFGSVARFSEQADNAHNLPLQFAAELGLPFTVLWFGLLAWLFARSITWRAFTAEETLAWGVLAVIGLHSLLEYPLWYAPFQIAVGLSAGVVFAQTASASSRTSNPSTERIWQGLAGICLVCFCAYAACDYHRIRQVFIQDSERVSAYQLDTFGKAETSWLFAAQIHFAKLTTTTATADNAAELWKLGHKVLHFSPEPLVFQALIRAGNWLAPNDAVIATELVSIQKQLQAIEARRTHQSVSPTTP